MRVWGRVRKVAPVAGAAIFGYALCSVPMTLAGGEFKEEDSNKKLKLGAVVKALCRISTSPELRLITLSSRWGDTHFQGFCKWLTIHRDFNQSRARLFLKRN